MKHKELGIAIVGSGRIGARRASMVAAHPAVRFLAVSDIDLSRARGLAGEVGAHFSSGDNLEVISRPEVDAVIVSTSEYEHTLPVLQALERNKPVLVEKPIAMNLSDADQILAAAAQVGTGLHVGYSRRFKRHYLLAKEQVLQGRLGRIVGGTARVYGSRAMFFQILQRSPHATAVMDNLTYYVDLMCWFMEGNSPVEILARGQSGIFKKAGYRSDDVTWAIVTFADGAVVNLGVCFSLPDKYPSLGANARLEVLGTEGVMLFDDDLKEQILYTDHGIPHSYVPDRGLNMVFLCSTSPGDWALGDFWGPLADETRAWLDHLSTGRTCVLASPEEARRNLEVTLAIDQAVQTGKVVRLPLEEGTA